MKFCKGTEEVIVRIGSGIRQGCGLAPLLWVAFTILLFDRFTRHLSLDQITGFADDIHTHWNLSNPDSFAMPVRK